MNDRLPGPFASLAVDFVHKKSNNEWSSSCPKCGGVPHKDGTPPDRFIMMLESSKGNSIGWCRKCGYMYFPERVMQPKEFEQFRKEQIEAEKRKKYDAERAIQILQSEKAWLFYHESLTHWARELWTQAGIPEIWQDYYELGFLPDYVSGHGESEHHSPALSIPVWGENESVRDVKLRLLNPRDKNDRYRSLYKGHNLFVGWPRMPLEGPTVLVEGEKKAMVTAINLNDSWQVVGLPGNTPSKDLISQLDKCDPIVLCVDPDTDTKDLTKSLGRGRIRILELPGKVDDLIVLHGLNINSAIRQARKA